MDAVEPLFDDPGGLLEEDPVLPAQLVRTRQWTGEQVLCWAILADAAACLTRYQHATNPAQREQYQSDWEWMHDSSTEPCSFRWTCAALGISPGWYRRKFLPTLARGSSIMRVRTGRPKRGYGLKY